MKTALILSSFATGLAMSSPVLQPFTINDIQIEGETVFEDTLSKLSRVKETLASVKDVDCLRLSEAVLIIHSLVQ
jgi:hypothetical protein